MPAPVIVGDVVSILDLYEKASWHLASWFAGEWIDPATGSPHFACVMACISRLVEAHHSGGLYDDRRSFASASEVITEYVEAEKGRQAETVCPLYTEDLDAA